MEGNQVCIFLEVILIHSLTFEAGAPTLIWECQLDGLGWSRREFDFGRRDLDLGYLLDICVTSTTT
jgi:hypothetical protein